MHTGFLRALAACVLATCLAGSAWAQSCSPAQRLQVAGAQVCVNDIQLGRMTPVGASSSLASLFPANGQASVAGVVGPSNCPAIVTLDSTAPMVMQRNNRAQNACTAALKAAGAGPDCLCTLLVQDGSVVAAKAAFDSRYGRPAPPMPPVMVAAATPPPRPGPAVQAPPPASQPAPVRAAAQSSPPPVVTPVAAPARPAEPSVAAAELARLEALMKQVEEDRRRAEKDREIARIERERAEEEKRKAADMTLAANTRPPVAVQVAPVRKLTAHALVIGNAAYQHFGPLANTTNDAKAIARLLESLGIGVDLVLDADRNRLSSALRTYREKARLTDVNLVFYAGHGVQVDGLNYLIPIDMKSDKLAVNDVAIDAVRVDDVINGLPARTRIIFLDACRDNPLANTRVATRTVGGQGLAPIKATSGTLISYATKDGQTADDGAGVNSPFTTALLQHLPAPQDISIILRQVRETVMKMTNNRQEPWEYGSLTGGELVLSQMITR